MDAKKSVIETGFLIEKPAVRGPQGEEGKPVTRAT
jgi:hypothetical protein